MKVESMRTFNAPQADQSGLLSTPRHAAMRAMAVTVAMVAMVLGLLAAPTPALAAGPSDGFQAGNIVSDANFYDGNAMTAGEVQSFLNQRVPSCWLGRPGYEVGKQVVWGGQPTALASKCTKDYVSKTESRASNAYCAAYAGGGNESSAQIIAKVGKACGISQRVLLITLEKEQSLISDPWPNNEQYFRAMGYACPDSGPGGTANCDRTQGGFFQQVYRAAWQLKVYKAFPNSYNYKAGQNNTIYWNPNAACGTSNVYIENWATAALYIYTPYRPNQAALNAGWGTGDSCSSYGNRNFYNFYKAWFGTVTISVHPNLQALAKKEKAVLGSPIANAEESDSGVRQVFEGGEIYWSHAAGAVIVRGGMLTGYAAQGRNGGSLGSPVGPEAALPGGAVQRFQRGEMYWRSSTGPIVVRNGIHAHFLAHGGVGEFGFPAANEESAAGGAAIQRFDKASITWGPGAGGVTVRGGILTGFKAFGGIGRAGFAVRGEVAVAGGAWQQFSKADAYWNRSRGVVWVVGGVRNALAKFGGVDRWGMPLGAEYKTPEGAVRQDFERGSVFWSAAAGGAALNAQSVQAYERLGTAKLGFPRGDSLEIADGTQQEFDRGLLFVSNVRAPILVVGGVRNAFVRGGGATMLGLPLKEEFSMAEGAVRQDFERGSVIWTARSGGVLLQTPILESYTSAGDAAWGLPSASAVAVPGGVSQEFARGLVLAANNGKPAIVVGGVRNAFNHAGGVQKIGFPLGDEARQSDGSVQQEFDKATIVWTPAGSRVAIR